MALCAGLFGVFGGSARLFLGFGDGMGFHSFGGCPFGAVAVRSRCECRLFC